MVVFDYFEDVLEGFEYLIALGSIVGLLGFMLGLIFLIWGGQRYRNKMLALLSRQSCFWLCAGLTQGLNTLGFFDKKKKNSEKD